LHNGIVEGPVTVTLTLQTNATYQLGAPTNGTVLIDDDMPMLRIFTMVTNVLEGSGSNGVFRLIRTGDPKYDFMAYLGVGGTATYGVDYPPFRTNVYFTCGVTSIDLLVTPTNDLVVEGNETVTAALLPAPAYTILAPSNAVLTIADAGTNQTPLVTITSPVGGIAFLVTTNIGLVLHATVSGGGPSNTLTWTELSGPDGYTFSSTNAADTTILFTNTGIYTLRLTADDGQLQGHADVIAIVAADALASTNMLHWPFDEGSGTNVLDVSGAGRAGQLVGAPVWTTNGILGGALNLSGTNDCVRQVRNTNFLNGLREFTLSLWLKPATTNFDEGFFAASDSGTNPTLALATRTYASCGNYTNVVEATLATTKGVVRRISASGALRPFQWQQVALVWSNGLAPALYINGQLDQPLSGFVAASGLVTNCPQFIVGKGAADSPNSWKGTIDDVRIFPRALSADEILALDGWPTTNHAPFVNAGSNVTVQLGVPLTLFGTVTDDGLPNPPGRVTTTWSYLGTNNLTIPDPSSLTNTFVFTQPGDYLFQLTADDGQAATFALVTVTAIQPTSVDIWATIPEAAELGPVNGEFTITRNGDTNDLAVYLAISSNATNGVDYVLLPNVVTFARGSRTAALEVVPFLDYQIQGDVFVTVSIVNDIAYSIGNGQATVVIHDKPYGVWSIAHFTLEQLTHPELSGPGADFNHDGVPNFAEYALNRDPTGTNRTPPFAWDFETNTNDGLKHLTLTYTRRLPPREVQYGVYVSTNLLTWNTGTNYVEEFLRSPDTNGITESVKTRALAPFPGSNNLFMNLRVWLQQVPN
jgi:concanavalin A-like lectin/glucanase superfamily protein/Calx-beta domain-containing protein/K319-like protein